MNKSYINSEPYLLHKLDDSKAFITKKCILFYALNNVTLFLSHIRGLEWANQDGIPHGHT